MDAGHGETLHLSFQTPFALCPAPVLPLTVSPLRLTRQVRSQAPAERQQILDHLDSQLADFLSDSKESAVFTAGERRELEQDVQQAQQHCQDLLLNMETGETNMSSAMGPHTPPEHVNLK